LFWVILALGLVVGVARATAIRWWRVPSDDPYLDASIRPTLRAGDLVILWRLTEPTVGDLVLCPEPAREDTESGRIVIGRIVAERSDTVAVKDGRLLVNDEAFPIESRCPDTDFVVLDPETEQEFEQHCSIERVGATLHKVGRNGNGIRPVPDRAAIEVNDGQVWLASDNRQLPFDSRDYGSVPRDECTETVILRLVSAAGYFDVASRLTVID
jgi:signal peptidase I